MLDKIKGLDIEPTNMCTLKCPQCSRTDFISKFPKQWSNKNLDLDNLKRFLDIDITDFKINLCGNYGDPIYYDRLFELISWVKNYNCSLIISTNGSYRSKIWWQELSSLLTASDTIIFGIDGLPDNFTNYRVNADWDSIKIGVEILQKSASKKVWQFIPFSYNEHQINESRQLASDMGFTDFYVLHSSRWDNETLHLRPQTVSQINFIKKDWQVNKEIDISPECKTTNAKHFITADGFYTPCCYAADHRWYYKTEFYKNKNQYDISKTTISQVLSNLNDYYNNLEDAKLNYCTFSCPKL